jgi:serine/threonine protein phosphatase PrpC
MKFAAITDKGMIRPNNEDNYQIISGYGNKPSFFIIADGMGGHSSGEIASKIAVDIAENHIKNADNKLNNEEEIIELINTIIIDADIEIQNSSSKGQNTKGMGTTFIIMIIVNNMAYIGHIGDSRVYIISNRAINRITTDHSFVEELLKSGTITKKQADNHPKRNLITRALGHIEDEKADVYKVLLEKNDVLLMCTDGLTNKVTEEEILKETLKNKIPYDICRNLVDKANERGGEDNITVIVTKLNDINRENI